MRFAALLSMFTLTLHATSSAAVSLPLPTAADYLAQGPQAWQPAALDASRWRADFVVAADGSGSHGSVQAAVDAVPARGMNAAEPTRRWFIQIRPGQYRGPLCVPDDKPPITLYGVVDDAHAVTLVDSRYNGLPKRAGVDAAHPCHANLAAATHGTSGSATLVLASADAVLAHLTVANDASEHNPNLKEGAQAVALMTVADRIQLEDVWLLSHQDTFYVKRPAPGAAARVYVRGSTIAGDVDFVFGNATLVIDDSTLVSRSGRLAAGRGGYVLAPSTPAAVPLGFLVQRSRFVADQGVNAGSTAMARAWDEAVPRGQWQPEKSPNGQALVRDSAIAPHISLQPGQTWAASTSQRAFDPKVNRMTQQGNTALVADNAREVLPDGGGWASQQGGTRGGADAEPADVHIVRNRAQLVAALTPHERPRIVKLVGRIAIDADDQGRVLTAEDFRDPAFHWPAFEAAYDPATWGRKAPAGPQEEARRASARRQAAHIVMKVPSRTTLIGMGGRGDGAQVVGGSFLLEKVSDIIIRNIRFSDAYDHFPAWDPKDNEHGEWNSEYDNVALRGATRVWIDHCTFDDGQHPDDAEPKRLGRRMQRHDGLLDITRASDHITVSFNRFSAHDKTSLVGGSDRHTEDEGRLKVTYHHNRWHNTKERSPRVRHGQVHVVNNLYEITDASRYGYSIGIGHRAEILSQRNAWQTEGTVPSQRLFRRLGNGRLFDEGSLHNGAPVAWAEAGATAPWTPPYALTVDAAAEVPVRVRATAGAGRLWTGAP